MNMSLILTIIVVYLILVTKIMRHLNGIHAKFAAHGIAKPVKELNASSGD